MGDEQRARERFSRDMRRLREDQGLSIKEVYDETRIAQTLIESFEEGRLYDHPNYNRVYLRSFVRAYGECVGISSERALSSLDAALNGTYEGGLGSEAITDAGEEGSESSASLPEGERASESDEGPEPPTEEGEERGDVDASEEDEGADLEDTRDESSEEEMPDEEVPSPPTPASPSGSAMDADDENGSADESDPSEEHPLRMDERSADTEGQPSHVSGEDVPTSDESSAKSPPHSLDAGGTGVVGDPKTVEGSSRDASSTSPGPSGGSPPSSRRAAGRRSRQQSRWKRLLRGNRREMLFAGIGIVIVSLVLAGLGFAYFSTTQVAEQDAATVVPDTTVEEATAVDTASEASEPPAPPADVTLGDQVHVMIQGTQPVTEIRIQRDQDLRRPYWIEEGDAAVFPFEQWITLEEELENIRLYVEGYPYPTDVRDPLNRIEITRDQVEEFVDTLRGSPASLSVTPDTIPAGNPLNFE